MFSFKVTSYYSSIFLTLIALFLSDTNAQRTSIFVESSNVVRNLKPKVKTNPIRKLQFDECCGGRIPPNASSNNRSDQLRNIITEKVDPVILNLTTSPQARAFNWIVGDNTSLSNEDCITERYALAVLYHSTKGNNWITNENWLTGADVCDWNGVQRETFGLAIDLSKCCFIE